MKTKFRAVTIPALLSVALIFSARAEDSSAGLPEKFASDYLIAASTLSPNEKFAVIYPAQDSEAISDPKNYVVALAPFSVLGSLPTKWPYFQNENHGGLTAEWSADSSIALITLDGKWGPRAIFLAEFHEGKLSRLTDLLAKAHDLLAPDFRKAKRARYNEDFDFIFDAEEEPVCKLEGVKQVRITGNATNDPKDLSRSHWSAGIKAVWDISQAKFTEKKITRTSGR